MPTTPPRLTRAQVREIDRRAINDFHIPGIVLMENAAIHAADVAWGILNRQPKSVAVVCGPGNNGGDGFAIARHLHNRGVHVNIVVAADKFKGDAEINWKIAQAMGIPTEIIYNAEDIVNPHAVDLLIDALFGTGLTRPITGHLTKLVEVMNDSHLPILAIDIPSGLDCDTGEPLGPACIRATQTITFVAEKAGFANPASKQYTGPITIADIGCPKSLIAQVLHDLPS